MFYSTFRLYCCWQVWLSSSWASVDVSVSFVGMTCCVCSTNQTMQILLFCHQFRRSAGKHLLAEVLFSLFTHFLLGWDGNRYNSFHFPSHDEFCVGRLIYRASKSTVTFNLAHHHPLMCFVYRFADNYSLSRRPRPAELHWLRSTGIQLLRSQQFGLFRLV